jgi:hypothetical protein
MDVRRSQGINFFGDGSRSNYQSGILGGSGEEVILSLVDSPLRRRKGGEYAAIVLIGVATGALIVTAPAVIAFAVPTCFVVLALVGLVRWLCGARSATADMVRIMSWTLGAFALHLAIGVVIWTSPRLTDYFGSDSLAYNSGSAALLQHWTTGAAMPLLPAGKEGFFYLLAGLYAVFGQHPQTGVIVDAGLAAGVIPVLYDATRRLFGRDPARYVAPLAALLPGFLIWGSQLLREAGVYFFIVVSLDCAVRLRERFTITPFVVLIVSAGLLVTWRADVGVLVAGGLVLSLAVGGARSEGSALGGLGAGAILLALIIGGGLGYSGYHLVTHTGLTQLNTIRANSSQSAASGFLSTANISTPGHAAAYLPVGSLYFLFGPFPWQIHGLRQLFALPDALVWWFLLPSLWRGVRRCWWEDRLRLLLLALPALVLAAVLSLLVANFGTAVRERMQVIVVLLPLVALGWSERRSLNLFTRTRSAGASHGSQRIALSADVARSHESAT